MKEESLKEAVAHSAAKAMEAGMAADEPTVIRSGKTVLRKSEALAQARVLTTGGQRMDRVIGYAWRQGRHRA